MRVQSWFLYLAYQLENHYLLQVSLASWVWVLLVAPPLLAAIDLLRWAYATPLSVLALVALIGLWRARRTGYLCFEPTRLLPDPEAQPPLGVDETIAGWTCGRFSVEGKEKQLVNARFVYSYVHTREHIVMAEVTRTRFLLLARSSLRERGYWYVFFTPDRVREVVTGTLWCGGKGRPALAVRYLPEERPDREDTFYLSFQDAREAARVVADLQVDVPAQAFSAVAPANPAC